MPTIEQVKDFAAKIINKKVKRTYWYSDSWVKVDSVILDYDHPFNSTICAINNKGDYEKINVGYDLTTWEVENSGFNCQEDKCTCGAHAVNSQFHSSWCDLKEKE